MLWEGKDEQVPVTQDPAPGSRRQFGNLTRGPLDSFCCGGRTECWIARVWSDVAYEQCGSVGKGNLTLGYMYLFFSPCAGPCALRAAADKATVFCFCSVSVLRVFFFRSWQDDDAVVVL
jgi:hypothetical protein